MTTPKAASTKICSNPECVHKGVAQPLGEFHNDGCGGKHAQCKACRNERNREHMRKYNQRPAVKERNRKYSRKYRQHPEIKERIRQRMRKWRQQLKRAAMERLGGCRCITPGCGCVEFAWLTISHENNDGAEHKRLLGSRVSVSMHQWILKTTDAKLKKANLAVRCFMCNDALQHCTEAELEAAIARNNARIAERFGSDTPQLEATEGKNCSKSIHQAPPKI